MPEKGRLIHYSREPLTEVQSVIDKSRTPIGKPRGLWVSVETGNGDGWRDWCIGEGFSLECLANATHVVLKPYANILLATDEDGIRFIDRVYRKPDSGPYEYDCIDWEKAMGDYQGVVIAPYVWQCRLERWCNWYYPWDCASGVIWDADAVASLTPAPEFAYIPKAAE